MDADERERVVRVALLYGHYEQVLDRESAYETPGGCAEARTAADAHPPGCGGSEEGGLMGGLSGILFGHTGPRGGQHDGLVQTAAKTLTRTMASSVGRQIVGAYSDPCWVAVVAVAESGRAYSSSLASWRAPAGRPFCE